MKSNTRRRWPWTDCRRSNAECSFRRVIDDLPDIDRRLMRALFVEERDKDEVCKEFSWDRSYLRVLLHRAKLRFRALYLARTDVTKRNG